MEIVTIEKLEDFNDVYEAIKWALSLNGEYPSKPKSPILLSKHNSLDVKRYASELEKYEFEIEKYKEELNLFHEKRNSIEDIIILFIKIQSGLNTIPEKSRQKVYDMAYENGHSSGYYQVYQELVDLVELF